MAGTSAGISRLIGSSKPLQEAYGKMSISQFKNIANDKVSHSSRKEKTNIGATLEVKLQSYQKQDKFCDITIIIGGKSFRAHKMVLAVASEYFETMFSGSFVESSKSEVEIDGDSKAFEKLLQFAYTGELQLVEGDVNALEILKLAHYMQFKNALYKCTHILEEELENRRVSLEVAFEITALAKSHDLDKLFPSAVTCLALDFKEFMKTGAFLDDLCAEVFEDVLGKPDAACSMTEPELLESIVKWLSHDLAKRRPHGLQLVKCLYLGMIPRQDVDDAREFFQKNGMKECCEVLSRKRKMKDGDLVDAAQETPRNIITAPLVTGGTEDNIVCYFDRQQIGWSAIPFARVPALHSGIITDHRCIVVNGVLYVAGGNDVLREDEIPDYDDPNIQDKKLKRFYKYDPESNSWTALESMQVARSDFAMIMIQLGKDDIYVIGGEGEPEEYNQRHRYLDEVECYSIAENKWRSVPRMPLYNVVAVPSAIIWNGKILVYGNAVTWSHECTTRYYLQMYDPEKQKWFKLCEEVYRPQVYKKNILTIHDGKCYRICFVRKGEDIMGQMTGRICVSQVMMNERRLRNGQGHQYGVIGSEQRQVDLKCEHAFCLGDEVFVLLGEDGYIYDTGIKASEIGPDGLDKKWNQVCVSFGENVTPFTFDILKLKPKK